jgi:RNA polymerase primary sigma factor
MRKIKTGKPLSERESESLELYLNEIGKEVLLSDDEEKNLAQKITEGGRTAENAVGKLVSANLRFVVSVASQYTEQGLSIRDLISEGNMAMMKAARSFDGTRGQRFVGYAEKYVREVMQHAINEQSGIYRLPKAERDRMEKENSRAFSVDAPLVEGRNVTLLSMLADNDAPRPDKQVLEESIKNELLQTMGVLNDRERRVVTAFYGIDQDRKSFAEIGDEMGIKRERARQIRKTALRKLGKETTTDMLKALL